MQYAHKSKVLLLILIAENKLVHLRNLIKSLKVVQNIVANAGILDDHHITRNNNILILIMSLHP